MRWTSSDINYMEQHSDEGSAAIAEALGCSVHAVEVQASRYGCSLRRFWICPKCGERVSKPMSSRTGWCAACTKAARREVIAEQVRDLEEEAARNAREDRERQRLYSRKNRARKSEK